MKRLQEPPGAREQTIVIWNSTRELPAPGRIGRNTAQVRGLAGYCLPGPAAAQFRCRLLFRLPLICPSRRSSCCCCCRRWWRVQEALIECVRRVVFQENAPMGQPSTVRLLIGRTQEQGVMAK